MLAANRDRGGNLVGLVAPRPRYVSLCAAESRRDGREGCVLAANRDRGGNLVGLIVPRPRYVSLCAA
ncbi:hypothetical protein MYIN104542_21485 [Mycobacterium intermedium]